MTTQTQNMNYLSEAWRSFKGTVKGFDSPNQLALGVVFGMLIGLIPKDSLLPYFFVVLALLTNANLVSIICSAITFSLISPLLDRLSDPIGTWALTYEPFEATWAWLIQLPIVPWTRFDNTVVAGSMLLGIGLAIPVYTLSLLVFRKFGKKIASIVSQNSFVRWIVGESPEDTTANPSSILQES